MAKTTEVELAPVRGVVSATKTELVVPASGATSTDLLYAIRNGLKLWVDQSEGSEADFLERTLTGDATSEESIVGGVGLTKLEDLLGIPLRITGYHGMRNVAPQYLENSLLGVYVIIELTDRDGQVHTTSVGSADAVGKIVKLDEANKIPQGGAVIFERSEKPTKSGFHPINMRWLPDLVAF
jgi:hypothetical protein